MYKNNQLKKNGNAIPQVYDFENVRLKFISTFLFVGKPKSIDFKKNVLAIKLSKIL